MFQTLIFLSTKGVMFVNMELSPNVSSHASEDDSEHKHAHMHEDGEVS